MMYNETDPFGWLQTWARICSSEFLREIRDCWKSHHTSINYSCPSCTNSSFSNISFSTLFLLCKVLAPSLAVAVILMIMVEFCCDNCCLGFFRSLLLCFAEISQSFTFIICKKDCPLCYSLTISTYILLILPPCSSVFLIHRWVKCMVSVNSTFL